MTMKEYYKMGIRDALELRKKVENLGIFLREEFVSEYSRYASVYKYIGNVYYVDSRLDIIDIK